MLLFYRFLLSPFSPLSLISLRHKRLFCNDICLSLLFLVHTKTKSKFVRKGFMWLILHSPSLMETKAGTRGRNRSRSYEGTLLKLHGLFSFLSYTIQYHLSRACTTHDELASSTLVTNQENAPKTNMMKATPQPGSLFRSASSRCQTVFERLII